MPDALDVPGAGGPDDRLDVLATSLATSLVVAVVGATATGKSSLALDLAETLGGEIVNADASQLYRGMDIGTAKVPFDQRRGIAHHQLDVLDIHEDASVAAYQRQARADIGAITRRCRTPVVVGGSGLYVKAALDVLDIPPTDPQVRAAWEKELVDNGVEVLYGVLTRKDPVAAAGIDPRNARRIVRALEVMEITKRPFSASMPDREYVTAAVQLAIRVPRHDLDVRIGRRSAQMWVDGFLAEVESLEAHGLSRTKTASRALGYAQGLTQLAGRLSEAEAIEDTARATRRLSRRQDSWFGADPRIVWLDEGPGLTARALAAVERARQPHVVP
ncbi:MAG: tRNA (adenosine(37)-N6)-dimethylallyltransferase MiaA [Dermatophilaceae bacterium]